MVQCTKCGQTKDQSQFSKSSSAKNGLQPRCKECNVKDNLKFRTEINPIHHSDWQKNNKQRTSELIKRCGGYLLEEKMLVKSSKTNQDMRADVATIGPSTIDQLHENNFNAIALKENAVLVINKQLVTEKLKQYSISLLVL